MEASRYIPSDPLKPFVRTFLIIRSGEGMSNRLLPDTSLVAAFRLGGEVSVSENGIETALPPAVITGVRESSRVVRYSRGAAVLLAIFSETGAAAFIREPLHRIKGVSVPLGTFFPRADISEIEETLAETPNDSASIAVIERFLLSRLGSRRPDPLVVEAVARILRAHGNLRIRDLARDLCISQDPFEKRFRSTVGASPKEFADLARFRFLVHERGAWDDGTKPARFLSDLAYRAGYFDQSHFIRDFKSKAGVTPREFFDSPRAW